MKTAKQWVEESNWSDELKELFWERFGFEADTEFLNPDAARRSFSSLQSVVNYAFAWNTTPEGAGFWKEVAEGKRTDIDRPKLLHSTVAEMYGLPTDKEYETLMRKLLEGLKSEEESSGNDDFTRGFNTGIREMNEKIDEALKKLEL